MKSYLEFKKFKTAVCENCSCVRSVLSPRASVSEAPEGDLIG